MELITNGKAVCDCSAKLKELEANLNDDGVFLHISARVRCDCGVEYQLGDSQREGRYWFAVGVAPDRA